MTKTAQRISDIAAKLSPEAQRALLSVAASLEQSRSFYANMSVKQRAEIDTALGEADRGDVMDQAGLDEHLDALFAAKA